MKTTHQAYIYASGAILFWSTVATAFKLALSYYSPLQLIFIAVSTSILALSVILTGMGKLRLVKKQFISRPAFYLLTGVLNPFLYYFVLFKAYDLLPAQQALSLNYTWAILLPLLSVPLLKHKLRKSDLLAALIAYSGVFVIATNGNMTQLHFTSITGVLLALASTVVWALYWIVNTKDKGDPTVSLLLSFLIGLPFIIATLVATESLPTWNTRAFGAAVYVGVFEMGITFVLWLMALKKTDRTASMSTLVFITPVLSVGFIAWILQEAITPSTFIGLGLIISALIVQKLIPRMKHRRVATL